MAKKQEESGSQKPAGGGIGGLFTGLTDLVEKLNELAEKGEELSKSGKFEVGEGKKGLKGVYGFSVRTGIGKEGPRVEPFGNIRKDKETGRSVVQEVREPIVDVFEEEDQILVLAEMPGVDAEDVKTSMEGDILTISAENGDHKYRKEILMPGECSGDRMDITCKNGIVELKCGKSAAA